MTLANIEPGIPFDARFLGTDPFINQGTGASTTDVEVVGAAMHAAVEFDALRFKSITSYRDLQSRFSRDADASPFTLAETQSNYNQSQFSQELQLSNANPARIEWLLGAYFFEERGDNQETAEIAAAVFDVTMDPSLAFSLLGNISVKNRSSAIFGHADISVTPKFTIGFGARFTQEEKQAAVQFLASDIGFPLIGDPNGNLNYDDFSPRISAQYAVNEETLLYASASQGFKSGGFTGRYVTPTPALQAFDPEELTSYEVGLKSTLLDKRLRLNIAGYFSDYEDIQILIFDGIAPQTRNAGTGEIKGIEIETHWLIKPNLRLSSYANYTDARYTSLNTEVAVELFEALNLDDNFVNTPEWSVGATLDANTPLSKTLELRLSLSMNYQDETANDAINTPELIQEGRTVFDGELAVQHRSGFEITLYGRNIGDETVIVSGAADIPTFGAVEAIYAPPREIGVAVNFSF